jgi:nicotinamidase/pyrazinamidase
MTRGLLIVDIQNDFIEGGALGVDGGTEVAKRVSNLLRERPGLYTSVYFSQDWHNPLPDTNGGHFAPEGTEPDYVNSWPVHCVRNTRGAQLERTLEQTLRNLSVPVRRIQKGQGSPDYSAFQGRNPNGQQSLSRELEADDVTSLDVVGIATDHCVAASALDALRLVTSWMLEEVRIVTNLVAGVDKDASVRSLEDLESLGAQLTSTNRL